MTPKQLYDILNEALPADCYLGDWHDHPTVTVDGGVDLAALAEKLTAHFALPEVRAHSLPMPTQGEILLACGEMTAESLRAAKAVLGWYIRKHSLPQKGDDHG